MHKQLVAVAVVATASMVTALDAGIIDIVSDNQNSSNGPANSYGGFVGTLEYDWVDGGESLLTITLENTSQFDGRLVALAFNDDVANDWAFDGSISNGLSNAWQGLAGPISTSPFGDRDFGASVTDSWLGGGSPNAGLAAGETGTWVFRSANASDRSALDFFTQADLVVRFRGFSNDASDKLPSTTVPGLSAMPLLGMVGLARRRRR